MIEFGKIAFGLKWLLIYHYEYDSSTLFKKGEELFFRSNDLTKYSNLEILTEHIKYKEYFEFMFEYPEVTPSLFHWKQKINHLETSTETREVGYVSLSLNQKFTRFGGLSKSADGAAFLDGIPGPETSAW